MTLFVGPLVNWILFSVAAFLLWYRNKGQDRIYSALLFFLAIIALGKYGQELGLSPSSFYLTSVCAMSLALLASAFVLWKQGKNYYTLVFISLIVVFFILSLTGKREEPALNLYFSGILAALLLFIGFSLSPGFIILGISLILFSVLGCYKHQNYIAILSMAVMVVGWAHKEIFVKHK